MLDIFHIKEFYVLLFEYTAHREINLPPSLLYSSKTDGGPGTSTSKASSDPYRVKKIKNLE